MRLSLLRLLLIADAAVLLTLGLVFVGAPGRVAEVFHFTGLPIQVHYLLAMWGCVLGTLGLGYVVAATDPVRHVAWIQVGIARGALELGVGLAYASSGVVSWSQAGFGMGVAAFVALAYAVLYPRRGAYAA